MKTEWIEGSNPALTDGDREGAGKVEEALHGAIRTHEALARACEEADGPALLRLIPLRDNARDLVLHLWPVAARLGLWGEVDELERLEAEILTLARAAGVELVEDPQWPV